MSRRRNRRNATAASPVATLLESYQDVLDAYVDPADAYRDDAGGDDWTRLGTGSTPGAVALTEADLAKVRQECRILALTNEFAINGQENRISYVVGTGHQYGAAARERVDSEAAQPVVQAVQAAVDDFVRANRWQARQQEIVRRRDRDGEVFLRFFDGGQRLVVRFIEPDQVYAPTTAATDPAASFGVQSDPDDVETVRGYWVDGQLLNADMIQHRKANVDSNVKRGVPLFYPVRKNLKRAEKILRNMSVVASIQSAIAIIRKHQNATKSGVETLRTNKADYTVTSQTTQKTSYFKQYAPGTILDSRADVSYEFPANAINAATFVAILQAELRAIASRLVMPEFMLTSDASNANYASTMVAEGPAVKMFERLQHEMIEADLEVIRRAVDVAASAGLVPQGWAAAVEISCTPPKLASSDRMSDAQADAILVQSGAMSPQTMGERHGLDADREQERIAELRAGMDPYGAGDWQAAPPDAPVAPEAAAQ